MDQGMMNYKRKYNYNFINEPDRTLQIVKRMGILFLEIYFEQILQDLSMRGLIIFEKKTQN